MERSSRGDYPRYLVYFTGRGFTARRCRKRVVVEIKMVRLQVRVIVTHHDTGADAIISSTESSEYDPELLDALVNATLDEALSSLGLSSLRELSEWQPEVSVTLRSIEEKVRPSLHLEQCTIVRLAEAGAAFDFDPYT